MEEKHWETTVGSFAMRSRRERSRCGVLTSSQHFQKRHSTPFQCKRHKQGEGSWAEEMFVMRLTYGKEEEVSGVFLCHVKSLLVRVICSKWIRHQNRGNKRTIAAVFMRGTRIWVSPQTRGLPPPIPIFARTKRCIPSQVCFAVCLQWKFRLAFSTSLHTPAA
jgi:hypothetical protein